MRGGGYKVSAKMDDKVKFCPRAETAGAVGGGLAQFVWENADRSGRLMGKGFGGG